MILHPLFWQVCCLAVASLLASRFESILLAADSTALAIIASHGSVQLDETRRAELLTRGATIYSQKCASCHGEKGQGVAGEHEDPLIGDRSISELAVLIDRTMPEGEPEACQGEDALAAAIYAYGTFYGEDAQARNAPPRAAMARLTAEQYRQSLSDLYDHFRRRNVASAERGMKAIYFNHAGWKDDKKAFERVDPMIDFDFGDGSPGEGIENTKFGIYWTGGLMIPETGRYELIAKGMGSFKVSFIDPDNPLFDNHVQSGDSAEFRKNLELVGGHVYVLNCEFIKRERKTGNVPARFTLAWKMPNGIEQPIPNRYLIPGWFEKSFAPQTNLPADDRSAGYERGSTISRQWDEATTQGAIEFADKVTQDLWPQYRKDRSKKKDAPQGKDLLRKFAIEFVDIALRRPAGEELHKFYVDDQLGATDDDDEALRRMVLLTLKSPRFLYPSLVQDSSIDFQKSSRLALTMWDSIPDEPLWREAEKGNLNTEPQIREMAKRMLDDARTKAKTRAALHEWLNLSRIGQLSKNELHFPKFDDALVSDLRTSLDMFLESVVWSEASDFRQLLQADWAYSSERITQFYGDAWKPSGEQSNGEFSRTNSDERLRVGVLTHPLLMSALAYNDSTSPIHRGVFLTRHLLGRVMRPPPEAFAPLSPDLHADLTTRQRVELQTGLTACQSCHITINALGFTLEQFDAVGNWRDQEKAKPINASGSYVDRDGANHPFNGARELSNYLVDSDDAQSAFINRLFLHFVKQPIGAYGDDTMNRMKQKFRDTGFNIRELIVEIAVVATNGPKLPGST